MNCPECEAPVENSAVYCAVCGALVRAATTLRAAPPLAEHEGASTFASWGRRFLATLFDSMFTVGATIVLYVYIFFVNGSVHFQLTSTSTSAARCVMRITAHGVRCGDLVVVHANMIALLAGIIVIQLAWGAYAVLALSSERGATIGMRVLKIRLVTADGYVRVSTARALGRWAAGHAIGLFGLTSFLGVRTIGGVPSLLDYLWPLWDKRNQTLHDKIAGTVALDVRT